MPTLENIKQLRAETDAPMKDCIKALEEAHDNIEEAKTILKKMGRSQNRVALAEEGYIAIAFNNQKTICFEAKCETDFVSRNENFRELATNAAQNILNNFPTATDDFLSEAKMKFKENIQAVVHEFSGHLTNYVYQDGKRASVVEFQGENKDAARRVAIQIVASQPKYISRDKIDPEELQKQTDIAVSEAIESGKPEPLARKIADGKVRNAMKEFVLLDQPMYNDSKVTVESFCKTNGITINNFALILVGK